jgi:hypothetical protein
VTGSPLKMKRPRALIGFFSIIDCFINVQNRSYVFRWSATPNWVKRKAVEARLRSSVLPASLTAWTDPLPTPRAACRRGQLGDHRRPSSMNRAAVSRSRRNPMLPARGPVCAAAPPVVTPDASGTKLGSNVAYLSRLGFLRIRLPLVWCQIAGSGAFYFAFLHPAACPRFDQYAPKTSRKGLALRRGQPAGGAARLAGPFSVAVNLTEPELRV